MKFIAEIGLNHNGDLGYAKELVDAAKESGATHAKFQTYVVEERVPRGHELVPVLEKSALSLSDFEELVRHCEARGIEFLTTVFGRVSVEMARKLGVSAVKIASFSLSDRRLLDACIEAGFALTVSTGASSWNEIIACQEQLVSGDISYEFLHCVSSYPSASPSQLHLVNIARLKSLSQRPVGFSDHSVGPDAFLWAALAGATIFEKHFTLDTADSGPDHFFSATPEVFSGAVRNARLGAEILGAPREQVFPEEFGILPFRTEGVAKD